MQLALYTPETSTWYALLNKAQAESRCYFNAEVESYLVYVLSYMSSEDALTPGYSGEHAGTIAQSSKERRLSKVRKIGEQCLVITGLCPDYANRTGIPLLYMMEKGRNAFIELANSLPDEDVYTYISEHFVEVIDVLQKLSDLCGDGYSIDLIQACELWQETGSRYGWTVIQNNLGAFPTATASELQH